MQIRIQQLKLIRIHPDPKPWVQYERESALKSWALGNHSSLGDYMFEIRHINEEENVLISGTREKSAVEASAEPKQYAGRLLFQFCQHFHGRWSGAYLGFCRGGCTFLADLPPPPSLPDPDLDPDPHQDFELDPDPAPDPHQNIADPEPWTQLSKDCCLVYNYV
jgi:hypothetical protein